MLHLAIDDYFAGRLAAAETKCRELLRTQPNNADAIHLLGAIANRVGSQELAATLVDRAIRIYPASADFHNTLGIVRTSQRQSDLAVAAFRRAIELRPDYPEAYNNLGSAYYNQGRLNEAIAACRRAIQLNPQYAEAYSNLGTNLNASGALEAAEAALRTATKLKSDSAAILVNLGDCLICQGRLDEALQCLRAAMRINPGLAEAHSSMGCALQAMGDFSGAMSEFRRAIELEPMNAVSHFYCGILMLLQGNFEHGWVEYDWRERRTNVDFIRRRKFAQPRWDGSDLTGKTILLYSDLGFGDAIQFARYATLVRQRGAHVILECQHDLVGLLGTMPDVERTILRGQLLPAFDFHCSLVTLPLIFGTRLETIPASQSYLTAKVDLSQKWKTRMMEASGKLKVGLVWAGNPDNPHDRQRSLSLSSLAPLFEVPGADLFSLQKGPAAKEVNECGLPVLDWTSELTDFVDTAALIDQLDLVISVDTAVAHLAGALGKPTWLLLPLVPDWRWMLDRRNSPWYPAMRVYRQRVRGRWEEPIAQLVTDLRAITGTKGNPYI